MGDSKTVDQILIAGYGKRTPLELEESTGIPAIEIAKRTEEALGRRDYLGENAEIRIIIGTLKDAANSLLGDIKDMKLADRAPALNSAAGALGRVVAALQKIQASSQVDVNAITANQGKILGEIVDIAVGHLRSELKERYGVDDDEIDEKLSEGMAIAQRELAGRVEA